MSFVVYNTNTTAIVRVKPYTEAVFKTMGAAKACKTRLLKKIDRHTNQPLYTADQLEVADRVVYDLLIKKMVEKTNLMTGKKYMEDVNTPSYLSPSSEAYWSA